MYFFYFLSRTHNQMSYRSSARIRYLLDLPYFLISLEMLFLEICFLKIEINKI